MNKKIFLFGCIIIGLTGCKSIKQPDSVAKELNYSDDEVIKIEINRIEKLKSKNSVKALWRSYFLGNETVIKECEDAVLSDFNKAIEDNDYSKAKILKDSLNVYGYKNIASLENKLKSLNNSVVPGTIVDRTKLPKSIANCVDATVTVWVDKGIKVENGSGIPDIVIGSGFFIDKRGYIITNNHVIQDCVNPKYEGFTRLYIKLPGDMDTKIPAKVIGYDPIIDLALLKVEIEPDFVFELGSSSDLNVGDKISVIGTPIGLEGTLTSGIISNTKRELTKIGNVFQIDAAVNSGNSGGPMIDQNYKVQAIIFAGMLQFQGLNFAIPVEYLKQELELLYLGGEIIHPWIGAYGHTIKVKNANKWQEVQYVLPGGPAHFAGLRKDCIIKEINGSKIDSVEDFHFALLSQSVGSLVKCRYSLNDEEKETLIYLEKRPSRPAVEFYNSDYITDSFIPLYGMKLKAASTSNRKSYRIDYIIKGSRADEFGFSENDPIMINDVKIDYKEEGIFSYVYIQRKSKGFLDVSMIIYTPFDSFNYF